MLLMPLVAAAQDLLIGKLSVDITKTADICSDDITGTVHFDADTKTLTLDNATLTDAIIQNNNVMWLNICLKGNNHITNPEGALFLLKPTKITGDGTLTTSCATDYSDIYHEASLLVENCNIEVGAFRGVFNAFLEIRSSNVTSLRGIYWHSGVALKDCAIVLPEGGAYDAQEHAISLRGLIYKNKVVIERTAPSSIDAPRADKSINKHYDTDGRLITRPDTHKGIHIIKDADGKAEKVMR